MTVKALGSQHILAYVSPSAAVWLLHERIAELGSRYLRFLPVPLLEMPLEKQLFIDIVCRPQTLRRPHLLKPSLVARILNRHFLRLQLLMLSVIQGSQGHSLLLD